jgi:hypothetical protein
MKDWQAQLEAQLSARDAPAVMSRTLLARFARTAYGNSLPPSSLTYWLKQAQARNKLSAIQRGLFLNRFRVPVGQLADAAAWLRRDAVVSLNTVLGDAGVLNNPSHTVTAVVPVDRGGVLPRLGRQATRAGTFHFFGIPRRVFEAGSAADRLTEDARYEHPRATPEKALLDWLYLASSPRSHRTFPPRSDIDFELLNGKRLDRLAKAAGMLEVLRAWRDGRVVSRGQ